MKTKISRKAFLGLVGSGIAGLGLSQINNRNDLRVERHEFRLPRWNADGFKIALLTDLHMDSEPKAQRGLRAHALALAANPDVILIGGDMLSTKNPDGQGHCHRALRQMLEAGVPTYAVLGNHEYWIRDTSKVISDLRHIFKDQGGQLLRNEVVNVNGVTILGVDDGIAGRDKHNVLHNSHDRNVVTLFHEPDFVDRIDARSSLMVAGHSHGGQVCLPFGIPINTPRGARKYIKGFFPNARVPLYVSRGVGTVGPGVRMFCPPEVSVLTLRSV